MIIISLEDLGFFKKGEAGIATENGQTTFGGKIVVNPSGGLKSKFMKGSIEFSNG